MPKIKEGMAAVIDGGLAALTTDYAMAGMQLTLIAASGAFYDL
jgi:hypothetical protein